MGSMGARERGARMKTSAQVNRELSLDLSKQRLRDQAWRTAMRLSNLELAGILARMPAPGDATEAEKAEWVARRETVEALQ